MTTPWRVGARGDGVLPWCIPLPGASSVADLQRAVEARQNKLRQEDTESPKAAIGIQLKVDGELYAVDSDDLLLNLIPKDSKGAMFVAYRAGGVPITPSADAPDVVAKAGAASVGSPDLNHDERGAPITPATAPGGAGPPNLNQASGGAPIQPPPAAIASPKHLETALSWTSSATWSYDAEEAAAVVAAAAASFRPAQCLGSFPKAQALSAPAATTVPSSSPLEVRGVSPAPARTPSSTPPAPTAIKTEDGVQDSHDSGMQEPKPRRYPKRARVTAPDDAQPVGFRHEFDWQVEI
ncbi:hypothetical protein Esi_0027_0141 [Ectocarpus siliculosus]|uniref:Uncharacterized protein n=1 Tax=Ectocarpus siliculosus TaxID=2880 RepID=D7FUG4_ECTSI|nr:hypothetical protein Esi_0027_0141 [Ectocarpus siliculosus]|eukprot:CBJ26234.1 hypothetical protein Esi_0027_0141 [Ectocarpus siliculosus]